MRRPPRNGAIYFTDPIFLNKDKQEQDKDAVYYINIFRTKTNQFERPVSERPATTGPLGEPCFVSSFLLRPRRIFQIHTGRVGFLG